MSNGTLGYVYFRVILVFAVTILFMIPFKVNYKKIEESNATQEQKEKSIEAHKKIAFVVLIIRILFIVLFLWGVIIPFVLDIPCIVKKEYPTISGMVIERTQDNRKRVRIKVKDKETGKTVEISIPRDDVQESYEVEVVYLPHYKVGEIKKKQKPQTAVDKFWEYYKGNKE